MQTDPHESRDLMAEWQEQEIPVPLVVVDSPYREVTRPVIEYVSNVHRRSPRDVVAVYVPEYVVTHWRKTAHRCQVVPPGQPAAHGPNPVPTIR